MNSLRVAVCDDSMLVRKKLRGSLEDLGVTVVLEASDGAEIVEKLKGTSEIDVLFLDIVMPNKTGIEALEEIKKDDRMKDINVVMVTSVGTSKHVKEAVKLGVFDFMQKPVDVNVLKTILQRVKGE
ncbi:response regulator [Anaerobacillus isosaccharinicus]|uniref:Response regulator n=1 Tax=Anaerobacillus isosaccharinicus TaxID=1532552 RepID=A0A1S2LIC7_9BACI|nr:response regulator [Anaerobacillus isosaccharinicus]MBA5586106.1 response regulator [Anaerobacillus isosaccharinicus]QOY35626.1 response regulator [Anaerobacillus isosaccharinicus]